MEKKITTITIIFKQGFAYRIKKEKTILAKMVFLLLLPFTLIYEACYLTGKFLLDFAQNVTKLLDWEKKGFEKHTKSRLKILFSKNFGKSLGLFVILAFSGFVAIKSLQLLALVLSTSQNVRNRAVLGAKIFNSAQKNFFSGNYSEAENSLDKAIENFQSGEKELDQSASSLMTLLAALPPSQDVHNLFSAAGKITGAGRDIFSIAQDASSLKFTPQGVSSEKPIAEIFSSINTKKTFASQKISESKKALNEVNLYFFPKKIRDQVLLLQNQIQTAEQNFYYFSDALDLVQNFTLGEHKLLVLFANNNELRPIGGFYGTFGTFELKDGEIKKMNISSIYDLDGQLKEKIKPPLPVYRVNDRWFLRDSNWFADFRLSAKKALEFYEKETGSNPDLLIVMTPNLVKDMLNVLGPISLPGHSVVLTAENFNETTEAISTLSRDMPENKPKQILADLFPVLLSKISNAESQKKTAIFRLILKNLFEKQIVMFSEDQTAENLIQNLNWDGSLSKTNKDYLALFSANLGGTKTDLSIQQSVFLNTKIRPDGRIINKLKIVRLNPLPDLPYTKNISFLRILVPQGAKLISVSGFDAFKLPAIQKSDQQHTDREIYDWEKTIVEDLTSGTLIGQEGDKSFFGNWTELSGGQTKVVELEYQLPFTIKNIDTYSLLVQKQPGAKNFPLTYQLEYPEKYLSWTNFSDFTENMNSIETKKEISSNIFLGTVLQKK